MPELQLVFERLWNHPRPRDILYALKTRGFIQLTLPLRQAMTFTFSLLIDVSLAFNTDITFRNKLAGIRVQYPLMQPATRMLRSKILSRYGSPERANRHSALDAEKDINPSLATAWHEPSQSRPSTVSSNPLSKRSISDCAHTRNALTNVNRPKIVGTATERVVRPDTIGK